MDPNETARDESPETAPLIVLVEDDASVHRALTFALRIEGYRIAVFESAEALLMAKDPPAANCLVVDLNLPGASGVDAVAALRARGLNCPAILITTQPKSDVRAAAERLGLHIVEKPLLGGVLPLAIRELLGR
ncbi:MAG: response regulator [Phenylobacterium sp.]